MSEPYSVVIPAYNAERTLADAIESVLSQTVLPAVTIVIDDGSTDKTTLIAGAYEPQVIVLQQENCGPGAATTRGFEAAMTPLVATLDADDLWLPDKASRQLNRFELYPPLQALFGRVKLFHHSEPLPEDAPIRDNWGRSTMMIRRAAALSIGPITDPPDGGCGDMVDWVHRARELDLRVELMPEVLALRRILPGSMSYDRSARGDGYLHVVKLALARKRNKPHLPGNPSLPGEKPNR